MTASGDYEAEGPPPAITYSGIRAVPAPRASIEIEHHNGPGATLDVEQVAAVWVELGGYGYWHITGDNTGEHPLVVWRYQIEPLRRLLEWCAAHTPEDPNE